MCHQNYEIENREIPCFENDICKITGEPIFELLSENKLAWDIYCDITEMSSVDINGVPTVDKIDFYFQYHDLELPQNEYEDLIEKIKFINKYRRYLIYERLKAEMNKP